MKVLVDTLSCGNQLYGVGQVLREHLRNLPQAMGSGFQAFLIVSDDTRELYADIDPGFERIRFPVQLKIRQLSLPAQLLWEKYALPAVVRKLGADVYWRPNLSFCQNLGCPQITTVHDLAEYHPQGSQQYSRVRLVYRRMALRSVMAKSDKIIGVSRHAVDELRKRFPQRASDILVASNGGPLAIHRQSKRPEWYLSAGRLHRHKNLMTLCRAYIRTDREIEMDLPLVILGGDGNAVNELRDYVAGEGYSEKILLKGYVSEAKKEDYMIRAKAFFFPSYFEGFGIPILESMALGIPVVSSNAASLSEVAGDAALLLDPGDEEGWAKAFACLRDGKINLEAMVTKGMENVRRFSWKDSTGIIAKVFQELAGRKAKG